VAPGVFLVANGSGDSFLVTENLREVIRYGRFPLGVETFRWSTFAEPKTDHRDVVNHRRWGGRMACRVMALRQTCPDLRIYLIGHSAGTQVILAAAEALPPGSVDRIILLAPSVSCTYDLRAALCSSRQGMDVYYSLQDGVLDMAVDMFGTADGMRVYAAGQVGFRCPPPWVPGAQTYARLRQYRWDPSQDWTCHRGGHNGALEPDYLRAYVLPRALNMSNPY
jgi:pimeloyl-ACP methyl ester carboxylesterase